MVKARINDCCMEGFAQTGDFGFPETEARIIFADVTDTAVKLQKLHKLDYPAAAELGRAIAAVALLGIDFKDEGDTITLCAETNAPIGGWYAEITGKGALRGYVHNPDAWEYDPPRTVDPIWTKAKLTRTDSDGDVIGQVSFGADSADMPDIMSSYYNNATRVNTRLAFCAASHDNRTLDRVRALGVQYIDNPNHPRLSRIASLFTKGVVARQIELDASTGALCDLFDLQWISAVPPKALDLVCTCSAERAGESVATLSKAELAGILRAGQDRRFHCHLCGRDYVIPISAIAEFAAKAE